MASLFGALASRGGEAIQQNAMERMKANEKALDRLHDMQVEKQRQKHQESLLDKRIKADNERESNRQQFELDRQESAETARMAIAQFEMGVRERMNIQDNATRLITTLGAQYSSKTSGGKTASGWSMETLAADPLNGLPERMVATKGAAAYELRGTQYVPVGETKPLGQVPESHRVQLEKMLMEGKIDEADFLNKMRYLPMAYVAKEQMRDDSFRGFVESTMSTSGASTYNATDLFKIITGQQPDYKITRGEEAEKEEPAAEEEPAAAPAAAPADPAPAPGSYMDPNRQDPIQSSGPLSNAASQAAQQTAAAAPTATPPVTPPTEVPPGYTGDPRNLATGNVTSGDVDPLYLLKQLPYGGGVTTRGTRKQQGQ